MGMNWTEKFIDDSRRITPEEVLARLAGLGMAVEGKVAGSPASQDEAKDPSVAAPADGDEGETEADITGIGKLLEELAGRLGEQSRDAGATAPGTSQLQAPAKLLQQVALPLAGVVKGLLGLLPAAPQGQVPPQEGTEERPEALMLAQAESGGPLYEYRRGQGDSPRLVAEGRDAARAELPGSAVTINVHAVDSRSFLDHSDEIAECVRQALMQSHPLRDVIVEL